MPAEALQVSRMLRVIPSDNANIPYPNVVTSGTSTSSSASKVIDSNATFITSGVQIGHIVYNTTDEAAATVTSVDSETQLTLNANIISASSKAYTVYVPQQDSAGCLIQTGGAGTLAVVTTGGDSGSIVGAAGQYHPVHLRQILASGTDATEINALW